MCSFRVACKSTKLTSTVKLFFKPNLYFWLSVILVENIKMVHAIFYLLTLLVCFTSLNAQENFSYESKLVSTAKIWGFLKYYHPQVASGKFDWDKELIDVLPKVESAIIKEELSRVYLNWINGLGEVKPCKSCQKKSKKQYFEKNFDLGWVDNNKLFSKELSDKLKFIENNRAQKKQYYVEIGPVGEAHPINENPFKEIGFPNIDYRMLGLFRYWNFIEYFYPNKYLTDKDWNAVLLEMIPKFLEVENEEEYFLTLRELFAKLDDSHTFLTRKKTEVVNIFPYKVKNINNNCVISGFVNAEIANKEGLFLGDVIIQVNKKDMKLETHKFLNFLSGSNLNGKQVYAYKNILSSKSESTNLAILRGNDTINKRVKLYNHRSLYTASKHFPEWKIMDDNIGYVVVNTLKSSDDVFEAMTALKSTKGIIFDLRGYQTMNALKISGFLNLERKPFAKHVIPDISYPGKFIWKNEKMTSGKRNEAHYKGQVIILADDQSFSLSEYAVMCLQTSNNSITIGSQTLGADGKNVSLQYLGGYKTSMTSQGVFYPDGEQTQRIGVKIDIEVKPTIKGLMEGRDEVLEKAIQIINAD